MKATATFVKLLRYSPQAYNTRREIVGAAIGLYQGPDREHKLHFQLPPHLTFAQAAEQLPRVHEVEYWTLEK